MGQIQQGLKDRRGKQATLQGKKPDLGKRQAKAKGKPGGGNAFDLSDGPKAKDFSKRGQASLGNRGATDFKRPSEAGGGGVQGAAARPGRSSAVAAAGWSRRRRRAWRRRAVEADGVPTFDSRKTSLR